MHKKEYVPLRRSKKFLEATGAAILGACFSAVLS